MRRSTLLFAILCVPLSAGCATERAYFFNHNPITDTVIFVGEFVGGFFEKMDNSDLTDVRYSIEWPADIQSL